MTNSTTRTALIALFAACFASGAPGGEQAAQTPAHPQPVCESNQKFNDFDFWLGEWNVYSNHGTRQLQGSNSITKQHDNCLVMENWTSAQGTTGSSMNYYDAVADQWRQLWVANGYSIDYTGGLNDAGSMVLLGRINDYKTSKSQSFRGIWTPGADGSVRQLLEQQDPASGEWSVWFDGLYIKKDSE